MDSGVELSAENPYIKANCFSSLLFLWLLKLYEKGSNSCLALSDLYKAVKSDMSENVGDKLERHWNEEVKKSKEKKYRPSLLKAIAKTFLWSYMGSGVVLFIQTAVLRTAQPLVLAYLINLFSPERKNEPNIANKMYISSAVLIILSTLSVFLFNHAMFHTTRTGMRVRVAVSTLVYRKLLRLSRKSLNEAAGGTVVNLLSNDVSRFDLLFFTLHFLWIGPIQVVLISFFIWEDVGVASLAGIFSLVLLTVPLQVLMTKLTASLRGKIAIRTDKRVKVMSEIISGIQVIKMYAWEKPFEALVKTLRLDETKYLAPAAYVRGIYMSSMVFIERTTLYATAVALILMGNGLKSASIFSMAQFFNQLQLIMAIYVPSTLSLGAESIVSIRRLRDFLLLEELQASSITQGNNLSMQNVEASWQTDGYFSLSNISIEIPKGKLCAIIGPVGSGKSSILNLLLGEMIAQKGSISLCGKVCYSSQEPWLFVSSVRNNILFGSTYDKKKYEVVTSVCALLPDFAQFPSWDKTIVGERGVSLSGGQRARINLARAVYKEADIYLLDDPLSAVDTHVGKHLFEKCVMEYLSGKTRILVTHQLQYLKKADIIVVMKDGKIEAMGTFKELESSSSEFTKLLVTADEVVENEKNAEQKTHKKSVSAMSIKSVSSVRSFISEKEEAEEVGLQGQSAFIQYYKAAGNCCSTSSVILVLILGQVATSAADYWISYWTDQEEFKNSKTYRDITAETHFHPWYNDSKDNKYYYYNTTHVDTKAAAQEPIDTYVAMYIYTGIIIALIALTVIRSFAFFKVTVTASNNLHEKIFHYLLKAPMRFFDTNASGRILNRFSKDVGTTDELLPKVMMETIQIILVLCGILTMISITNYFMIPVIFIFGVVFVYLRTWYLKTAKIVKHLEGTAKSPVFSHINSSLNGITTIRACKAQTTLMKQFDHHQDTHTSAYFLTISCTSSFGLWLDIISTLFTTCVIFGFIILNEYTTITGSYVGLAISQSLILTGMLQYGIRQSAEVVNNMISVERILQYTTLEQEGPFETVNELDKAWPQKGHIQLKNMSLRYAPDDPPVLQQLTAEILPAQKIGIVGRTGAGKSSLISAIFRLTQLEGSIEIDGIDTQHIGLTNLRKKIAIIPQEPVLFSASLRYNLDPFREYDDELLWKSLEEVELKNEISSLDSEVGEGGSNFSLGQRQLLCLARASLKNNKILVLDEATANVDPKTDELIQKTLRKKFAHCTVLTIAHRLNTIMDSDKVIVMDKGKIMEFDHPHILLQNENSIFKQMVDQTGINMTRSLCEIAEISYKMISQRCSDTSQVSSL